MSFRNSVFPLQDLTCLSQGMKFHLGLYHRELFPGNTCSLDDWVGFSLCFLLISYVDPPELCKHDIEIYLYARNGKELIASRTLPPMNPYYPHLYILYLSIDQFRDEILKDGYWSENGIEFVLKCYCCCRSLQIVRCGCRLVCKQDVKDWNKVMNQFNES